jgi:hypothetical protein
MAKLILLHWIIWEVLFLMILKAEKEKQFINYE